MDMSFIPIGAYQPRTRSPEFVLLLLLLMRLLSRRLALQ